MPMLNCPLTCTYDSPERSDSRFLMCLRRSVAAAPVRPERSKASGWNDVLSSSAALKERGP